MAVDKFGSTVVLKPGMLMLVFSLVVSGFATDLGDPPMAAYRGDFLKEMLLL